MLCGRICREGQDAFQRGESLGLNILATPVTMCPLTRDFITIAPVDLARKIVGVMCNS
jgi:hypothetical protein